MSVVTYVSTTRALTVDLVIEQGVDLDIPITVVDDALVERNFSTFTAQLQVREFVSSSDVLFEMSTINGKITTGDGKITLHFLNTDFVDATWRDGEYDLEVTSSLLKKERIMRGHFRIDPEVTR